MLVTFIDGPWQGQTRKLAGDIPAGSDRRFAIAGKVGAFVDDWPYWIDGDRAFLARQLFGVPVYDPDKLKNHPMLVTFHGGFHDGTRQELPEPRGIFAGCTAIGLLVGRDDGKGMFQHHYKLVGQTATFVSKRRCPHHDYLLSQWGLTPPDPAV